MGDAAPAIAGERSFEARFAAAWWAIENGLTTEVAAELRELHALDPKHQPAARMAAVLTRLDEPCIDPDFDRFQNALGIATRVARGPHVILLHQHSDAEADERIALSGTRDHRLLSRVRRPGSRACRPAQAAGFRLVRRSERLPGLSPIGRRRRVRHDTRLLSPDLERRGRLRRPQQRPAAHGSRSNWPRSATKCSGIARWSNKRPRGAGSRSSSPTNRRGPSAAPRQRRSWRGSTMKSRARRCFWISIGGRSTWERRPTR